MRYGALHCAFAKQGPQTDELTPKRSPSRVVCVWCLETQAEWDAAPDCLALGIRKNGPSNQRVSPRRRSAFFHRDCIRLLDVYEHE